jgi:hypothetical protein
MNNFFYNQGHSMQPLELEIVPTLTCLLPYAPATFRQAPRGAGCAAGSQELAGGRWWWRWGVTL